MKKAFLILLILVGGLIAASSNTENSNGVGYGSAAQRDTSYTTWESKEYIDTYFARQISLVYKITTSTADTVIYTILGSNQDPDSVRFYYVITADTLLETAYYDADSLFAVTLPFGTASTTSVIPRYLKVEIQIADSTSGVNATATIADSWISR